MRRFDCVVQVMLFDGLTVVTKPPRLLSDPIFKIFISPITGEREAFGEGQDLEAMIMEVRRQSRRRASSIFASN